MAGAMGAKRKKLDFPDKVALKESSLQDNNEDDSDFDMGGFEEDESAEKRKPKKLKLKASKSQRKIEQRKDVSEAHPTDEAEAPIEEDILDENTDPLTKYKKSKTIQKSESEIARQQKEEEAFILSTKAADEEFEKENEQSVGSKSRSSPVSSKLMWAHLISLAKEHEIPNDIYDFRTLPLWNRVLYKMCGSPQLPLPLKVELERVFTLTEMELCLKDEILDRMLQTVYLRLMGGKIAMPKFGTHWEDIGFQRNDPSTDVRGSGLFGIAQLLCFTEDHTELAVTIHKLSTDKNQNFPFALVSFNLTGLVLQALRQTKLYSQIKELGSVLKASNELHAAMFYEFYLIWKNEKRTIMDFDPTLKLLQKEMAKNSKTMIERLHARGKIEADGHFEVI